MTFRLSLDGAPAGMEQQCLGAADMLAEAAIALRLARLLLQRLELRLDRRDDVVEPQQIVFGSLEPQFGLVAARMKPGGAGSLFEKKPALRRLGFDQRTHSPLTDHRPGMCARCGVGKQQLDIACPHLMPVDPIDRAAGALDAAGNLDLLTVVEGERRIARTVVERQRDLGEVARRPVGAAGEDHIIHLAAAQPLGRGLAHDPAQRLDQVRFAATVGSDDTGETGADCQLRCINERLEPDEAKPVDLHHSATRRPRVAKGEAAPPQ